MIRKFGLALCLWMMMICCAARAEISSAAFEAANRLYEQGKFKEAAAAYEALTQSGQSTAALYFNLGNAFFKSSQIGRAIAAYRQAAELTPRDPDLRANLQFARNQVQGPTLPSGIWVRWLGRLSLNEWTVLATVAVWALFLLLAVVQWRPALKAGLRGWVLTAAAAAVVLCACLGAALYQARSVHLAIVVKPEAVARYGPLNEAQDAFTVHDGAELRIMDRKDEWLEVSAGPRRLGWLRRDQVAIAQ